MFASTHGYYKGVPCPTIRLKEDCKLLNCPFSHNGPVTSSVPLKRPSTVDSRPKKRHVQTGLIEQEEKESLEKPTTVSSATKNTAAKNTTAPRQPSIPVGETSNRDVEVLSPATLVSSPAQWQDRIRYLKVIHEQLVKKNHTNPKRTSIEAEEKVARESTKFTYPQNIRNLVKSIRDGSFGKTPQKKDNYPVEDQKKRMLNVVLPIEVLKKYGYLIEPVVAKELSDTFDTECARCGERYNTGSKRTVKCVYHALRPVFEYSYHDSKKIMTYGCCSQNAEHTQGCQEASYHVFKLNDHQQMASVIPFSKTPEKKTSKTLFAAGIDCEMGYTNFGMELIRVTIVDWETNKTVLDRTVHPYGAIIDLNSRFSGVHSLEEGITDESGNVWPSISFKEARSLIFEYVSASTIIIGHGLENDLNAMRLVHHRIIDTALMYPVSKPTRRVALKTLARKYLSRIIQQGEHDSSEDAIAAMDIVTYHIKKDMDAAR